MRGNEFRAVQARLGSFRSSGSADGLLGAGATADLTALRLAIGWPAFGPRPVLAVVGREIDAIVLAGQFCWERSRAAPFPDRLDSMLEATELFAAAFLVAPGSVPAQAADIQARTIKFPAASNKGHPQVMGVEKFAELVAQKSGGKLTAKPERFFDREKLRLLRQRQIDAVRYLDGVVEELFDMVPDNTWITITADHGELFGEAGYFGHGPVHHEKVYEVPFVEGKLR